MSKRRKKWILVGAGLFLGSVAALIYLSMREDPQYVSAAQGLEKARADAKAAFGTLTWDDYREERGVEFRDDREAWRNLKDSTPKAVSDFYDTLVSTSAVRADVYIQELEWFDSLPAKIEQLRIHHVFIPENGDWTFESPSDSRDIVKALGVAIIGAADIGDADAMGRYARAALTIVEALEEEPSWLNADFGLTNRRILVRSVGRAAIKNRADKEVFERAESLLHQHPPLPSTAKLVAGQFRTDYAYIETLQSLQPVEVGAWLDNIYGTVSPNVVMPSLREKLEQVWHDVFSDEDERVVRRTGPRTADALEARVTECTLELWRLDEPGKSLTVKASDAISEFIDSLDEREDPSYELAGILIISSEYLDQLRFDFYLLATKTAIEMARRFPEYGDLPEELPVDLAFSHEYGRGAGAVYRKTSTGFLIYSFANDGTDEGFVDKGYFNSLYFSYMMRNDTETDMGLVVSYSPADPMR